MKETTIGTIETMLESVLEETDDSEIHFKLRSALSLLSVVDERQNVAREALEEAYLDPDVRENLRELGYLDWE